VETTQLLIDQLNRLFNDIAPNTAQQILNWGMLNNLVILVVSGVCAFFMGKACYFFNIEDGELDKIPKENLTAEQKDRHSCLEGRVIGCGLVTFFFGLLFLKSLYVLGKILVAPNLYIIAVVREAL
jgi:hypothetical protein